MYQPIPFLFFPMKTGKMKSKSNYLRELDQLNQQFCQNAAHFSYEGKEYYTANRTYLPALTYDQSTYRSLISGDGEELLFVLDLDYYGSDLNKVFVTARKINELFGPFFIKFSGQKGFHLISRIVKHSENWQSHRPERIVFEDIQTYFKHIAYGMTKKVKGVTINREEAREKDWVWVDLTMYRKNKTIRTLCIHLKTGLFSVPVSIEKDDLNTILERAALKRDMGIDTIVIPDFGLYGIADPGDELDTNNNGSIDQGKIPGIQKHSKIRVDRFPPCLKKAISIRQPYYPNHFQRFFLATWMLRHGYRREDLLEFIKSLNWLNYDRHKTEIQVDNIIKGRYRYIPELRTDQRGGIMQSIVQIL